MRMLPFLCFVDEMSACGCKKERQSCSICPAKTPTFSWEYFYISHPPPPPPWQVMESFELSDPTCPRRDIGCLIPLHRSDWVRRAWTRQVVTSFDFSWVFRSHLESTEKLMKSKNGKSPLFTWRESPWGTSSSQMRIGPSPPPNLAQTAPEWELHRQLFCGCSNI